MRRDQAVLVEGVLRDFPSINSDRIQREQWLEIMAVSPGGTTEKIDGGTFKPVQDRYLDVMDDTFLKKLQRIVKILYTAYTTLEEPEKRVIALCCFEGMDIDSVGVEINANYRYVQRKKASGFNKLWHACLAIISDVEDWRERKHIEFSRQLSSLSRP